MIKLNEFPTALDRERVTTLGKYDMLYDNNAFPVLGLHEKIKKQYKNLSDLVYIAHAVPFRVTDFYSDFVRGDVDRLIISAGDDATEEEKQIVEDVVYENDLKERIFDFANEQSKSGFAVLLGRVNEDGIYMIDSIPADQYFPQSDGSVVFATYRKDPDDMTNKQLVIFVQQYKMVNGKCTIERAAFRTNEHGVTVSAFPIDRMAKLLGKEKIVENETLEIDELPIRQIDNGKRTKYGVGASDYSQIIPSLAEVNERSTHISTQLLKNMDAKMTLPKEMFKDDGTLKNPAFEAILMDGKDNQMPSYISNTNTLIDAAERQILAQLKTISFITGVPMFEILKATMPESAASLRIQLFAATRKTQGKRSKLKRGIVDMFRIGGKLLNNRFLIENDVDIEFESVIPEDELTVAQTEQTKVTAGLSSKKSAMMRMENYDSDEADAELLQIQNEDRVSGVTNPVPPTLDSNPPEPKLDENGNPIKKEDNMK